MTYQDFISSYPEFNSVEKYPETIVEEKITYSGMEIDENKWGIYYSRGRRALTAHLLSMWYMNKMSGGTNRADIVLSKNPDVMVEFLGRRTGQIKPHPLEKTDYGVEYKRLMEIVAYSQPRQTIALH